MVGGSRYRMSKAQQPLTSSIQRSMVKPENEVGSTGNSIEALHLLLNYPGPPGEPALGGKRWEGGMPAPLPFGGWFGCVSGRYSILEGLRVG